MLDYVKHIFLKFVLFSGIFPKTCGGNNCMRNSLPAANIQCFGHIGCGDQNYCQFNTGGQRIRFENNIIVDCPRTVRYSLWNEGRWRKWLHSDLLKKRLREAVDILKPPYSTRYPELAKIYETKYDRKSNVEKDNFVAEADDPNFVDGANGSFALKADAPILKKLPRLEDIPFGEIGRRQDRRP